MLQACGDTSCANCSLAAEQNIQYQHDELHPNKLLASSTQSRINQPLPNLQTSGANVCADVISSMCGHVSNCSSSDGIKSWPKAARLYNKADRSNIGGAWYSVSCDNNDISKSMEFTNSMTTVTDN